MCKRLLSETGADGIRLDELGSFVPCFNPAHHHKTPLDSNQWMRELVRKVRAAMDEVNPDAILNTEGPIDYLHESCDGALQMFQPGRDIDAMRVAIPSYIGFAYHPGAVESAMNGWVGGKTTARRVEWPWGHRGLSGPPTNYKSGAGPELRWHELRASFPEAIAMGEVTVADPEALSASSWVGRLWKGKHYWLLVGGALDGSPLGRDVTVRLPGLPASVEHAYEFDATTLAMRTTRLWREKGKAYLTTKGKFGSVFLPLPDCPPLLLVPEMLTVVHPGEKFDVQVESLPTGRRGGSTIAVTASCPGLFTTPKLMTVPGTLQIRMPRKVQSGYYRLSLSGDCLPVKRWFRVVP